MNKVLAFIMVLLPLAACTNGSTNGQATSQDSVVAVSAFEEPTPGAIMVMVCDSIAALHPANNDIARMDAAKDLKEYVLTFKGQHMPLLEELTFELKGIVQEGGKYVAALKYGRNATRKEIGLEVQIAVKMSRDEAAKYSEGAKYKVKGLVKGFAYNTTQPYVLEPIESGYKQLYSLGAIELTDAELIPQ